MKMRRKIAFCVIFAMLFTFIMPLERYATLANTIVAQADLVPRSTSALNGFTAFQQDSGTVSASISNNNLVITNSGGSYPCLLKNNAGLGFNASKQIYLEYDFTITGGQTQVRLATNSGSEFKLGVYLGLGDIASGTYTGKVNLTRALQGSGLITNGTLNIDVYNLYVIGNGASAEFRTLEIYTEDAVNLLPYNQAEYNDSSKWSHTSGVAATVTNNSFTVKDNGDYSSGAIGYQEAHRLNDEQFETDRRVILKYDIQVLSGHGQVALRGNNNSEFKIGHYLGIADLPTGRYTGEIELTKALEGSALIQNNVINITQVTYFAVGLGEMKVNKLEIERRPYVYDGEYEMMPLNQNDYQTNWKQTGWEATGSCDVDFSSGTSAVQSIVSGSYPSIVKAVDWKIPVNKKVTIKYDFTVNNAASIFMYAGGSGMNGAFGEMKANFSITGSEGDIPSGTYQGEADLSKYILSKRNDSNFAYFINNGNFCFDKVRLTTVGGSITWRELALVVEDYDEEFIVKSDNAVELNLPEAGNSWSIVSGKSPQFGTVTVSNNKFYYQLTNTMDKPTDKFSLLIDDVQYDMTARRGNTVTYSNNFPGISYYQTPGGNALVPGTEAVNDRNFVVLNNSNTAVFRFKDAIGIEAWSIGGAGLGKVDISLKENTTGGRESEAYSYILPQEQIDVNILSRENADKDYLFTGSLPGSADGWSLILTAGVSNSFSKVLLGSITVKYPENVYENKTPIEINAEGDFHTAYRIRNYWTNQYMYTKPNDNKVYMGDVSGDTEAFAWIVEYYNGYVRLKNAASNDYLQDENKLGYVVVGGLPAGDFGSRKWNLELNSTDGWVRFKNTYSNNTLLIEGGLGYVESISHNGDFGTSKWYLEPCIDDDPRTVFSNAPTSNGLTDTGRKQERWLSVPESRLVINPYLFGAGVETAEGNVNGGWDSGQPQANYVNSAKLPLNIGYLNPYYSNTDTGDFMQNAMMVLDSSIIAKEASEYRTSWAPHMLGFSAKYDNGMLLEGQDFFYDTKTIVRRINYTGDNAPVLAGAYWGNNCYVDGSTLVIINTGAKKYITTITFNNEIDSIKFYSSYNNLRYNILGSSNMGTKGFWKVKFKNVTNHTITAAITVNSDMYSIYDTMQLSKRAANDTRLDQKLTNREEYWNDFLRKVPQPGTFELTTIDSKGVTSKDVERMYYNAWILLGQDILPENPETGFYHKQMACGKPSMWGHGSPKAAYTAAWDSIYGYQMYSYIDPDTAWDCYTGLMSLVERSSDGSRDGMLAGESLPVNRARTAWILYQAKPDINKLRENFSNLDINLWWSMNHTYWIYGDINNDMNLNLKDSDFTAAVLVDLPYMIKICQLLGETEFEQIWTQRYNQFLSDFQQWHVRWYDDGAGGQVQLGCNDGISGALIQTLWATKALYSPDLSSASDAAFYRRLEREYDINKTFMGFSDVKLEEIMYTIYGLYDNGYTSYAKTLTEASIREVVRASWFTETYSSGDYPIGDGVAPSLFGAVQLIDSVWIRNGYRYDAGVPAFQNFFDTGSLKNIRLNGETFDYVLENGTVKLWGSYIDNGYMEITANPNTVVKPLD